MKQPAMDLSKYIGRDYKKYNCFQLVQEFYRDQFNLELMHSWDGRAINRNDAASLIVSSKGDFVYVTEPQFGDIVIIKLFGIECHMGVIIEMGPTSGSGKFLHSARNIGSILDRLEKYSRMIGGFYRHQERV